MIVPPEEISIAIEMYDISNLTINEQIAFIDNFNGKKIQEGFDLLLAPLSLSEINPAIFTSVSNYIHDEVAILLPADQRFDDDENAE